MVNLENKFIDISFSNELRILAPVVTDDLIRLGSKGDGGYLLPKSVICKCNFLLSFGINDDWNFEIDFLKKVPSALIHGYDHTISEKKFRREFLKYLKRVLCGKFNSLENLRVRYKLLTSYKNFFKGNVFHFKSRVHNRIESSDDITIEQIFKKSNSRNILLKMDIEGSEYRVINDILKHSDILNGLIIEFHDIYPFKAAFMESIKKIQENYFIAHLHANNHSFLSSDNIPEVLEITFVRKDFLPKEINFRKFLPLESLDIPCNPNSADYRISFS